MAAIKQTFFQECEEQLAELEIGLIAMSDGDQDSETVNAVFRAVHSVKGGAGAFNLVALVQFAHVFESALDLVRTGRLAPSPEVLNVLLRATDVLADIVRAARRDETVDDGRSEQLAAELSALADPGGKTAPAVEDDFDFVPVAIDLADFDDLGAEAPAPGPGFAIVLTPTRELYAKGNDPVILLREVDRLGTASVTCDTSALPLLDELDPENSYLSWSIDLETTQPEEAVREIFDFVEWDCTLTIEPRAVAASAEAEVIEACEVEAREVTHRDGAALSNVVPLHEAAGAAPAMRPPAVDETAAGEQGSGDRKGAASASPTIRVDLERVDRLIDLVGELVINQAMLAERVLEAGLARASAVAIGLDELEQLTREIQDSVMAIRAQPVKSVFQRMPRLAREVAALTGKSVRLVTEGEGTEVDKTVIERLSDPLTHMIRNAIDHGVEAPAVRVANGKNPEGIVRLNALHRSGRIVIEVSDDGAGIDRDRVKAIAVERNLIQPDDKLTDDDIDNLIFVPGFSTAATVTDISGRGVGMDVVKRSILALGGRISISSRPGRGSTFTMSLPLTLAVLDGMVVTVAGQTLVIPLTAIIETLLPKATTIYPYGDGTWVLGVRDSFIPLVDVGILLGFRPRSADLRNGIALLVEAEGGARCALLVDAIQGQRQVVIKSLERNYGPVPGIAAATILGDGRVALILDVDSVVSTPRSDVAHPDTFLALAG